MEKKDIYKIKEIFAQEVEKKVQLLLEEKHLYQSVRISLKSVKADLDDFLNEFPFDTEAPNPDEVIERMLNTNWIAYNPQGMRRLVAGPDFKALEFKIVSVKTFCGNCGESSPMNLKKSSDALANIVETSGSLTDNNQSVYVFSFQCQNCRDGLEVFFVARKGEKLTLVGRSPMEQVQIPRDIPNDYRKYYSGAIIAYNSGQVLPGLFMLRTLIEQFTRNVTDNFTGLADEVLNDYKESLPDDFKRRFPSLNKIYSDISEAIHKAEASEELFINNRRKIEDHFEAKRIFQVYEIEN